MLTYICQSVVLQFLNFEKRCQLGKNCRELSTRHKKLPFYIQTLKLSFIHDYFYLKIDDFDTWIFPEPGNPSITCISHEKHAMERGVNRRVDRSVTEVSQRVLAYYLGREGTIVSKLHVTGSIQISSDIPRFKVSNLQVCSDTPIAGWFHVVQGNRLCHVTMSGRAVFELMEEAEILNFRNVTIIPTSLNIQSSAIEKMTRARYLRLEFNGFLGNYHRLSEEILQISAQNRPIGSIVDYYVRDPFNTKLYPNFAKIIMDLKAKRTKIGEINAITVPMTSGADLNVFLVPEDSEAAVRNTWILRMEVMKRG